MNVYYLASVRLPNEKAHGIQIMKVCEAIAAEVEKLTLVLPGRKVDVHEDPFVYYGVQRSFDLVIKKSPYFFRFGKMGFIFSQILFSLRTLMLIEKTSVIISQDEWVLLLYVLMGRKCVYEVHNGRTNFAAKFVAKRASLLVANSQGTKEFYRQLGVAEAKILVFPNGVDIATFDISKTQAEAKATLDLPLDKKIILYTGHLYDWKGADTFAASAKFLPPESLAVFVGGTSSDVLEFTKTHGENDNVLIVGHKPVKDMPLYLRAADILVIPNNRIGESEKFTSPMKLFEYLAAKKPIVASDLPSIREILSESSAYFFAPGDPQSLAQTIVHVQSNVEEAKVRALNAYQDAKKYTWNRKLLVERLKKITM